MDFITIIYGSVFMQMNKKRFVLFLLVLTMVLQSFTILPAMASEATVETEDALVLEEETNEEEVILYVATNTTTLKVRREPYTDSTGIDSIPSPSAVYIYAIDNQWAKVQTETTVGYVLAEYLTNICEYDAETQTVGDLVTNFVTLSVTANSDEDGFVSSYYAYVYGSGVVYEGPSTDSGYVTKVDQYDQVIVGPIEGDWCPVKVGNRTGYMPVDVLFKWDYIDPYAGKIPDVDTMHYMAFTAHTTSLLDPDTGEELFTINPGAAIAIESIDEDGTYNLPYWRQYATVTEDDIATVMEVVPYDEAEPGDLISVMTTYFAVGISTLQYQGRNWNIHHAATMISGTILQPNEKFDMHDCIGSYVESTGYHSAPIWSATALSGYGGGTCQVNTTFYIANVQIPILVTHRKVHADVGIYYAPVGLDAAVGGGDINLQLTNTLPYAIRYQYFMSDGVLTCAIFRES